MKRTLRGILLCLTLVFCAVFLIKGASLLIPSGTWRTTGALSSARASGAAALLQDGRILVTGGDPGTGPVASADFFQADGSVVPAPPMVNPRSSHFSVTLQDGRVLVGGGI